MLTTDASLSGEVRRLYFVSDDEEFETCANVRLIEFIEQRQ